MKNKILKFFLPISLLILTSCSTGFKMIDEGEHGNTYSGGSTAEPTTREELEEFIGIAKTKLDSDEYKKYDSKWSNVYLENTGVDDNKSKVTTKSVTLIKENTSLTSEIVEKGNEVKKNIVYSDATDSNKIKVYIDRYLSDSDVKHYCSEESKSNGDFEYLDSYHDRACMSYLDNMKEILETFETFYNLASKYNSDLNETFQYINFYKGVASIKQNDKINNHNYLEFNLQNGSTKAIGAIYFTGSYDIKKLTLRIVGFNDIESSEVYVSLLPYDKKFKPLSEGNRDSILPKDIEKTIH